MWNPFKSNEKVNSEDFIGETPSLNSPMKALEVTQEMLVSVGETQIWYERKFNVYENYSLGRLVFNLTIEQQIAKMNKDFHSKVVKEGLQIDDVWYPPHVIKSITMIDEKMSQIDDEF